MRFLRFLMNVGLALFVAIVITFSQCMVYNVISWQSSGARAIHLVSPEKDDVNYTDIFSFWISDIKAGHDAGAKYRIRNWFSAEWWNSGMRWADVSLDWVLAIGKPLVVPVAQIDNLKEFYGRDLIYFFGDDGGDLLRNSQYKDKEALQNAIFEYLTVYKPSSGTGELLAKFVYGHEYTGDDDLATTFISSHDTNNDNIIDDTEYGSPSPSDASEAKFGQWVRVNKALYNYTWKIEKYNNNIYKKYYDKFITEIVVLEENGDPTGFTVRELSSTVTVLYTIFFTSNLLAIIFVIKYPINFWQARITGRKRDVSTI